ncbi:hypothetical protein [Carnobacterium divergens]|uniref:hypothetical protein n=1 Tax=Carnobacterium divergens TaxID=2748 RepID=UPI0039C9B910
MNEQSVTGHSYSVAFDLIKEVVNNHEIIVIDRKDEYDFMKKSLPKNVILVKCNNKVNKLNIKVDE